jgi:hypothetical protein
MISKNNIILYPTSFYIIKYGANLVIFGMTVNEKKLKTGVYLLSFKGVHTSWTTPRLDIDVY